jgi:thioredoxin reductase
VDRRKVIEVGRDPEWFSLSVQDGEPFRTKRVIVSTGIAHSLGVLRSSLRFPRTWYRSIEHRDFSEYAGGRILVVAFPFTRS